VGRRDLLGGKSYGGGRIRVYGCSPGCLIVSLLLSLFLTLVINLLIRAF
jgi:ribose/xylose/arabinose/galactoside ABC-type transport system permease subunit